MRRPITVIVPAGNRYDVIEDCLQSVRWADEVLVVDSLSTDGTLDVARRYADRVLQHAYINSALQKNWAIPQATHEWVLIVDTDERVPPALRTEISGILNAANAAVVGYRIPRFNYFLGKQIRHGGYYPDYQIRFFRRDSGRYAARQVHAHVILDGPCGTLQAPLVHYAHRSLDQTIRNLLVLMTTWEAEHRGSASSSHSPVDGLGLLLNLLARPPAAFALRYFRQGGWRDGYRGLMLSILWSVYVSITYMKVWEKSLHVPKDWWATDWAGWQSEEHDSGSNRLVL